MARLCIDRCLLGTDKHLVASDGAFEWVSSVPNETWWLNGLTKDDCDWCADTVLKLARVELSLSPPERFSRAMSLVAGDGPVPWQKVMPSRAHRSFVKGLVDAAVSAMATAPTAFYRAVWVAGNAVVRSLQPIAIDGGQWRELLAAGEGNVPALKSLKPNDKGFARPIAYDRFNTCTGRLTVASGPQVLTLKREHRGVVASRYGDQGTVVSVDFSALEVRVLLYQAGNHCADADLYGALARELGTLRDVVKLIVISRLYGRSVHSIRGVNGSGLKLVTDRVDERFGLSKLLQRLKAEFVATGCITDHYGKRVPVDEPLDHVLINYWAQATGVDIAMMGFAQITSQLPKSVVPVATIHDALWLDVPRAHLDEVRALREVTVPGFSDAFPLKVDDVSKRVQISERSVG